MNDDNRQDPALTGHKPPVPARRLRNWFFGGVAALLLLLLIYGFGHRFFDRRTALAAAAFAASVYHLRGGMYGSCGSK